METLIGGRGGGREEEQDGSKTEEGGYSRHFVKLSGFFFLGLVVVVAVFKI